jgi:polysaccharide chain length determinant protein (PEP-CTERM system associated)
MTQLQSFEGAAPQPGFDPRIYLRILRRRYAYLLVPAVVVFAAVYWWSTTLPPVYQAKATILVQSQLIPSSLAQSTVTANADERIQTIQQRLMTRDNLLAIARKYGLYADQPQLSPSDIIDRVRGATSIQQIDVGSRSPQGGGSAIGFTVSFNSGDPTAAAKVANEFVTSILEQNIQARTQGASQTSKFFDQQVTQLQSDLAAQGQRIVDFKAQNQATLPETLASRQAILVQQTDQANTARSRIDALQTDRRALVSDDGTTPSAAPDSIDAQLAALRLQLVQLRAVYSDSHPEVRAVVAKIAALQAASSSSIPTAAAVPASGATGAVGAPPVSSTSPNARRIADIDSQIDALNKQLTDLEERTKALDASIQKTPETEVALNALTRDYNSLQAQYSSAVAKSAEAATGQQLEQDRQSERFEVLEQATVPGAPISPDRRRIQLTGGFGGVVLGAALVMLLEALDRSIRSVSDLEQRLHLRPIASIPYITTASEQRRRRRVRLALPLAVLLGLSAVAAAVNTFYLPLGSIPQKVSQRLGF